MHGVGTMEGLDQILAPDGALEGALEAKAAGLINHIGISMHGQPDVLIRALKEYPFEAVMTTINYYDHFNFPEIQDQLIPLTQEIGCAVILMKPIADGLLWRSPKQAFRYAFSQEVSIVVTGINNMLMLETDLEYANEYTPMTDEDIKALYTDAEELGNYVCRQCDQCLPCPEGVPITEIFQLEGYYDRQMADGVIKDPSDYALKERLRFWFGNKDMAINRYKDLSVKADSCTECGVCTPKCPYDIDIIRKLSICDYKLGEKAIF